MKRLKHNFKKGMAFVLSLAMVAGLVPAMSGGANTVKAATGTGTEPSVSAYATKTQLMDGTFAPNGEGTAANYGKLVFGKNSKGNPQEWYILGADSGVSGGKDNTIIFAASPIATGQKFNSNTNSKIYNYEANTGYGDNLGNIEVYPNHYGASKLRDTLQGMATNTSYFTSAEQGLMNATTVTTKDTKNSSVTYTTTDKLYALQGDLDNDQYLWAGTDDSTVLAMSSYLRNGEWFWLRSPYGRSGDIALCADRGYYVILGRVDIDSGSPVQPASNLDLSSVLFASAATAASSDTKSEKITDSAAMTLRLDGTGKDIGTVTYNTTTGDIKVVKGTTSQTVALVLQGNDGTNDWYYSKTIGTSETINASNIKSALQLKSDIDLSACEIWLEITEDNVSYAVNAEKEIEKINTTYVTKEQLMNSFKPYSNGTAVNYGKLVFGKKSDGTTAQEWYILGKDTGVSGGNTIIVAASPIARGQKFNSDTNSKIYNYEANTGYGDNLGNIEVYPNHYGASKLRDTLQGMATNTSYFTSAEQGLMNATTVTTKDTKNSSVTYTTTDKLYALQGDLDNDQYLWAGTDDSTVLAMSSYLRNGEWFWLRSPYGRSGDIALCADRGYYVILGRVDIDSGSPVQPASNLDLSSVLFASAATAASSDTKSEKITDSAAMTLRLDGTGKDIGTVTYNTTTGDIKVVKGYHITNRGTCRTGQ